MKKITHNKKSNTGLLFELLAQQVVSQTVSHNDAKAKKALYLMKKYFSKGTALNEELQIINSIMYNEVGKWSTASRLLSEVLSASLKVDRNRVQREKFQLISEINTNFDKKTFYSSFVPNYKVYSSLWALIESTREKEISELTQRIKLEEIVINHLLENEEIKRMNSLSRPKDGEHIDDLVFHFIIKKFNENWDGIFSPVQREILHEYIQMTSDKFSQFAEKTKKNIESELYEKMKSVKDKNILQKLFEAMMKFDKIESADKEKKVEMLLTYQQLVDEFNRD